MRIINYISVFILAIVSINTFAGTQYYRASYRDDPSTTIVLAWCDNGTSTNATVYYGTEDFGTDADSYPLTHGIDRTQSANGLTHRFARLSGLQPGTVYYFVVKDQSGTSARMSFKTLSDDANDPVCFISGGDTRTGAFLEYEYQQCRPRRQEGNRLVAKIRPDFVAFSGDFTFLGTDSEWEDWFADWELAIGPEETKGRLAPVIVVYGNHEANDDLFNMFDIPNANNYFALNIGGKLMRLYNLNTDLDCDGTQIDWFTNDLQLYTDNDDEPYWKAIQYHVPIVPHGEYSTQTSLTQCWATLFPQYGIRLSMDGHTHVQKITYPIVPSSEAGSQEGFIQDDDNGTVFIGEGCWGAPMRELYTPYSWTRASDRFPGFFVIDVSKPQIAIRTVKFENVSNVGQVDEDDPAGTKPSGLVYWDVNGSDVVYINNTIPLNDDATLADLNVSEGTLEPVFNASTYNYTVELPAGSVNVPVTVATPNDPNANVEITNAQNLTGSQSERTTNVVITAEDGSTSLTYSVEFSVVPAADATLATLVPSAGTLVPVFDANTYDYTVMLPGGTSEIPTVSATATDPQASVDITQATAIDGTATVLVTASDQSASNTYTVNFSVTPSDAKQITSFIIPGQIGQSIINDTELTIAVSMPLGTDITSLTPSISYIGSNLNPASGVSQDFTNPVIYTVTAADNSTAEYIVTISLQAITDNANLASLWTDIGELTPIFNASTLSYTVDLPVNTENVEIFAETEDPAAVKHIYPPVNLMGTLGERTGTVLVVAADGTTTKLYRLVFTGANSVEKVQAVKYMAAYPNPVKEKLIIEISKKFKDGRIELYNGLGHLLKQENLLDLNGKVEFEMSKYASGVYYVFLRNSNHIESVKILKTE